MSSSTEGSRRAEAALDEAKKQLRHVQEQKPLVRNEAKWLDALLQENNLAARFRKAMRLRFGGSS